MIPASSSAQAMFQSWCGSTSYAFLALFLKPFNLPAALLLSVCRSLVFFSVCCCELWVSPLSDCYGRRGSLREESRQGEMLLQ